MATAPDVPNTLPLRLKDRLHSGWRRYRKLDVVDLIESELTMEEARIARLFCDWLANQKPMPFTGPDYVADTYLGFRDAHRLTIKNTQKEKA
jgi:hypothetical protein